MYFKRKHKGKKKKVIASSSVSKKKGGLSQWEFDMLLRQIPFREDQMIKVLKTSVRYS